MRLSIDDFGTGYSSLSYLRQFPMDGVKIAKPFVDHVADGADDSALARAIITIGETLELEVVAEGIEQEEQMLELRRLGCKLGQGFYASRPVHARRIAELLSEQQHGPRRQAAPGAGAALGHASRQQRLGLRHDHQHAVVDAASSPVKNCSRLGRKLGQSRRAASMSRAKVATDCCQR